MRVGGAKMFSLLPVGLLPNFFSCLSPWRPSPSRSFMRFLPRVSDATDAASGAKGFTVVPATIEHRALVAQRLRSSFFRDEPLMRALRLAGSASPALEDYVLKGLTEGLSLMAVGRSPEDVLGICLNATIHHNEPMASSEFLKRVGRNGRALLEFDEFCFRESNLFRRYFVSHLFEVRYLAVASRMRRSGLAKALTQRSLQMAKELGYPMAVMHCTSQFSCNLAKSLGMSEAWSLPYNEYNPKTKPRLRPAFPHTHVRMMVVNL